MARLTLPASRVWPVWRLVLTPLAVVAIVSAARWRSSRNDDSRWLVVAKDSGYEVALDTSRISQAYRGIYQIWYRTDHYAMRFYKEKAFNREVVEAMLECRNYRYKIARSEMSVRGGPVVELQVLDDKEVSRQRWHDVEAGSTDADVARAACIVARSIR